MQEISVFRRHMDNAMAGLAMSMFTLNVLGLNYFLSTIGLVLMVTSFRALRNVSRPLFACYILSIVRTALSLPLLVLNATVYGEAFSASPLSMAVNYGSVAVTILLLICLRSGIREAQKSVGLEAHSASLTCLLLFSLLFFTNVQLTGLLLAIGLLVVIIIVIRCLFGLIRELDEAGFTVESAPVRVSDAKLVKVIALFLAAGILCGYAFGNRYPMDWQAVDSNEHAQVQEVKEHLLALGFPDYVLNDLTAADILACQGALEVVVHYYGEYPEDAPPVAQKDDLHEFLSTGVSVRLPEERQHWKIFQHFLWQTNPDFCGTEALQIWPACRSDLGWDLADPYTGRVLYSEGSSTYAAPYHSLGSDTYTADSIFWGPSQQTDVFATFSMPHQGENHRGYISYGVQEMRRGVIVDGWINYIHQESRFQYPVQTAREYRMNGGMFSRGPFRTIQDALQFYPSVDGVELIG